jgi:glycogen phosphorylase
MFSRGDASLFQPLVTALIERDRYLVFADYEAYAACQRVVGRAFRDVDGWTRTSILNVARTGWFSSDRAIREYCDQVWRAVPVRIGG